MKKLWNKRESNFELLRIVSMLFIVAAHFSLYNDFDGGMLLGNQFIYSFFRCGGKLGVFLFLLITGYFMINSNIKVRKMVNLEFQVLFYTIGSLIFWLLLGRGVNFYHVFKSIFPNLSGMYWFFTSYFALYLFIPFINKFLLGLKKEELQKLLLLGFVFLILIPSVFMFNTPITDGIYLVYYYVVGSYIKLYFNDNKRKYLYLFMFIFSYFLIVLISMFIKYLSINSDVMMEYVYFYTKSQSVLVFVSAVSLFMFFKNVKVSYSGIINKIASCSFGVYLFHENVFMREILWKDIFIMQPNGNLLYYFVSCLFSVVCVYIIGGVVDFVRQIIFNTFSVVKGKFL